jgi:hypothetical protein
MDRMARADVSPTDADARRKIVAELAIKRRMAAQPRTSLAPDSMEDARVFYDGRVLALDLHGKTEEQAWGLICALFRQNPGKRVRVITGASGILRVKFQDWIMCGALADYATEWAAVNRGAFDIRLKK